MNVLVLLSLTYLLVINRIEASVNPTSLSDCDIIPLSVYDCEDVEESMHINMYLTTVDDNGGKVFSAEGDVNQLITEDYMLEVTIDRMEDGSWTKNMYNGMQNLCSTIRQYGSRAWKNLMDTVVPSFDGDCDINTGHYEMLNLTASPKDFDFPVGMAGIYRVNVKLISPDDEVCMCVMAEGEVRLH